MAKYKWYKKRRRNTYSRQARDIISRIIDRPIYETSQVTQPAWRQEILGEFAPREYSDNRRPNQQELIQTIETELRDSFDDLIGQRNDGNIIREVETRVRNTLSGFMHRGLIVDHGVEVDDDGRVNLVLRPNRGVENIILTIQLDS